MPSAIFENLTASEVAALTYAIGVKLNDSSFQPYLSPIRELPKYHEWLAQLLKCGYKVTLVGKDLTLLMERITRPDKFWAEFKRSPSISVWLATTVNRNPKEETDPEHWDLGYAWYEYLILPDTEDMRRGPGPILRNWICANISHVGASDNSLSEVAFYFYWWPDSRWTMPCTKVMFNLDFSDDSGNHWWDREESIDYHKDFHGRPLRSPAFIRTIQAEEMFETSFVNVHVDPFHLQTVTNAGQGWGKEPGRNMIRMGLKAVGLGCSMGINPILIPTSTNGRCHAYARQEDRAFPKLMERVDNKKRANEDDEDEKQPRQEDKMIWSG